MADRNDTDGQAGDRPETPVRRPWHAPQFYTADMSSTDNSTNGGNDGGVFPPGSSS